MRSVVTHRVGGPVDSLARRSKRMMNARRWSKSKRALVTRIDCSHDNVTGGRCDLCGLVGVLGLEQRKRFVEILKAPSPFLIERWEDRLRKEMIDKIVETADAGVFEVIGGKEGLRNALLSSLFGSHVLDVCVAIAVARGARPKDGDQ